MYQSRFGSVWNKIKQKSYDWWLFGAVIGLVLFGFAFLSSALIVKGQLYAEFFKQLLFGFWLGLALMFVLAKIDYHKLFEFRKWIFWINFGLLFYLFIPIFLGQLLYSLGTGIGKVQVAEWFSWLPIVPVSDIRGVAFRWIDIFGFLTIQPSEIAKLTLLIIFAYYLNQNKTFNLENYKKPFWMLLAVALITVLQPDLGTVIIMFVIILSSLFVSKVPFKKVATYIILPVILFGFLFLMLEEYRRTRVLVWISTSVCHDDSKLSFCQNLPSLNVTTDDSLQVDKVRELVSSGGVWGVGYGKSDLKDNVPELSTDGIISVIGAEGGFMSVLLMMVFYFIILDRGLRIAKNAPDVGGRVLATGIVVWITTQALWNLTGMTGYMPMKGLPLPFVSEGGTAMLLNLASIGILLNISSQKRIQDEVKKFDLPKRKKVANSY